MSARVRMYSEVDRCPNCSHPFVIHSAAEGGCGDGWGWRDVNGMAIGEGCPCNVALFEGKP